MTEQRPAATPRPWPRPSGCGYAEADPTLDVDGTDAAHKLAILAQIAFGVAVPFDAIDRRGIAGIDAIDIRFARRAGLHHQAAGGDLARPATDQLALHVSPVLLRQPDAAGPGARARTTPSHVVGDAVGDTLFYGRGAGQMPTASAVVADLIDLAIGRGPADVPDAAAVVGERATLTRCGRRRRCGAGSICGCWWRTGRACWRRWRGVLAEHHDQHRVGDPARGARRGRRRHGAAGDHDAHGGDGQLPRRRGEHRSAAAWRRRACITRWRIRRTSPLRPRLHVGRQRERLHAAARQHAHHVARPARPGVMPRRSARPAGWPPPPASPSRRCGPPRTSAGSTSVAPAVLAHAAALVDLQVEIAAVIAVKVEQQADAVE